MSGLRETCAEFIAAHASQAESGNDCHAIAYMEQTRTGLAMGRLLGTPMSVPHERVVRAIAVALDDERRQTQRQMIAALYWRAGEHRAESERATHAAPECMETASGVLEYALREHRNHMTMWCVAQNMEAACPR